MKKSIIYINGIKASAKDLFLLEIHLKSGRQRATAHKTKNGNFAIRTEF